MIARVRVIAGVLFVLFGFSCAAFAQQAKEHKKEKVLVHSNTTKEVQGEVTWFNKRFIAIRYGLDKQKGEEYEILLPVDEKNIQLQHLQSLNQIEKGDTVTVQYDEDYTRFDSNRQDVRLKARGISFVKKGVPAQNPQQPSGDDVLSSQ